MSALRKLAATAVLLVSAPAAEAMTYQYSVEKGGRLVIQTAGDIEVDEGKRFLEFTDGLPAHLFALFDGKATIVFDSRGGNLHGGFVLAHIVWNFHLTTSVAKDGQCASACVVAWAAGARRQMEPNSRVGVHQTSLNGAAIAGIDGPTAERQIHRHHGEVAAHQRGARQRRCLHARYPIEQHVLADPGRPQGMESDGDAMSEEDDARLDDRSCWAKPERRFICGECDLAMEAEGA
jgi:Clp protease